MLKQLSQKNVKENWEEYKAHIETAFVSTAGGHLLTSGGPEDIYKVIYGLLINPFNNTTHLWRDDTEDYLLLTEIQECSYTGKRTLVLTSNTRTKDVDDETRSKWYFDSYKIVGNFAKENKCVGMYCYSDLDYFAKMAKETQEWSKVITRYQFYFPL